MHVALANPLTGGDTISVLLSMPGALAAVNLSSALYGTPLAATLALSGSARSTVGGLAGAAIALIAAGADPSHPSLAVVAPRFLLLDELLMKFSVALLPELSRVLAVLVDAGAASSSSAVACALALLSAVADDPDLLVRIEADAPEGPAALHDAMMHPETAECRQLAVVAAAAAGATRGLTALRDRGLLSTVSIDTTVRFQAGAGRVHLTNAVDSAARGGHLGALMLLLEYDGFPGNVPDIADFLGREPSDHNGPVNFPPDSLGAPILSAIWGVGGSDYAASGKQFAKCVDALVAAGVEVWKQNVHWLEFLRRGVFDCRHHFKRGEPGMLLRVADQQLRDEDAVCVVRSLVRVLLPLSQAPVSADDEASDRDAALSTKACEFLAVLVAPLLLAALSYGDYETVTEVRADFVISPFVGAVHLQQPLMTSAEVVAAALSNADPESALDFVLQGHRSGRGTWLPPLLALSAMDSIGPAVLLACFGLTSSRQHYISTTLVYPIPVGADGSARPEVLCGLRRLRTMGFTLDVSGVGRRAEPLAAFIDPQFMELLHDLGAFTAWDYCARGRGQEGQLRPLGDLTGLQQVDEAEAAEGSFGGGDALVHDLRDLDGDDSDFDDDDWWTDGDSDARGSGGRDSHDDDSDEGGSGNGDSFSEARCADECDADYYDVDDSDSGGIDTDDGFTDDDDGADDVDSVDGDADGGDSDNGALVDGDVYSGESDDGDANGGDSNGGGGSGYSEEGDDVNYGGAGGYVNIS